MNHKERSELGKLTKKCEEGELNLDLDENFNIKSFKIYGKARDFKKHS